MDFFLKLLNGLFKLSDRIQQNFNDIIFIFDRLLKLLNNLVIGLLNNLGFGLLDILLYLKDNLRCNFVTESIISIMVVQSFDFSFVGTRAIFTRILLFVLITAYVTCLSLEALAGIQVIVHVSGARLISGIDQTDRS